MTAIKGQMNGYIRMNNNTINLSCLETIPICKMHIGSYRTSEV